jgi:hypothetical protein
VAVEASDGFAESGCIGLNTRGTLLPRQLTLGGFIDAISRTEGVDVSSMEPLTLLLVWTENSVYRIILLQPGESRIAVQGGRFFANVTEGRIAGSSFGGSLLKVAWIGVGLRLELYARGQRIVTSRVRGIEIQQDPAPPIVH